MFDFAKGARTLIDLKSLKIQKDDETLVDISFQIEDSFALVGQSGSGKSLTLKALLQMVPKELDVNLELDAPFSLKRGDTVALVPQNPFTALSPLTKIYEQFLVSKEEAQKYFEMVGLSVDFLKRFPSELSGGQLQRVVIAFALQTQPKLLLLDEPTTALDAKNKDMILDLIEKLHEELGFSLLFVSHDMNSVKRLCKNIGIIYKGKIVENGMMQAVLENPQEAYTKELTNSGFSNRSFRQ